MTIRNIEDTCRLPSKQDWGVCVGGGEGQQWDVYGYQVTSPSTFGCRKVTCTLLLSLGAIC